jgi:hypothetical protein
MPADSTKLFNEWLVTDGVRAAGMPALIVGVAQNLNAIGFDLIRITVMVRTLHPEIESIRFGWTIEHTEIPPIGQPFFLKKRIRQVGDQNVEEISFFARGLCAFSALPGESL